MNLNRAMNLRQREVTITNHGSGYGFTLARHLDGNLFISSVDVGGVADGLLQVADHLLEINGTPMQSLTFGTHLIC
jgi:hypothetical protein